MTAQAGTSTAFWNRVVRPHGEQSHARFRMAIHEDVKPVELARHASVYWARKRFNQTVIVHTQGGTCLKK